MSDLNALLKGVLDDLDGAGALADWLQEHEREREAVLLRRRWKAWQGARCAAPARAAEGGAECVLIHGRDLSTDDFRSARLLERADQSFRDYIRWRFAGVRPEQVPEWAVEARGRRTAHAVAGGSLRMPLTACGTLGTGFAIAAGVPKGGAVPDRTCRECRRALLDARLKPPVTEEPEA